VNIDLGGIFAKLSQNYRYVLGVCEHEYKLQLCYLNIYWIVVFAEEDSYVAAKHLGASLKDEDGISKSQVLHLWTFGEEGEKRWRELARQGGYLLLIRDVIDEIQNNAYAGQDDS